MNSENKVVNIINFIRSKSPDPNTTDLVETVEKEIILNKKYGFDNTFLIQYDALILNEYTDLLLRERDEHMEIGVWFEIAKPLVEKAGLKWRGRKGFVWDWHVNPGFLMAYTQDERKLLIDIVMEEFKRVFGSYPRSVGSWLIDSFSMEYMSEKYNIDAYCICREQYGTDGYTLWGGYYNQAYYPSKRNMIIPAASKSNQINVPVFRMLGIDPIHAYDDIYVNETPYQGCKTMEPFWSSGADENWVRWYLKNNFEVEDLGFSYTQIGQENSFGYSKFGKALEMQFRVVDEFVKEGKVCVKKLCDTGSWFKKQYDSTPATAFSAMDYWGKDDFKSIWYDSKKFRANLFCKNGKIWFRDINIFNDSYIERYYDNVETGHSAVYDAFPIVDGLVWSDDTVRAGLYFDKAGTIKSLKKSGDNLVAEIAFEDLSTASVIFSESGVEINNSCSLSLKYSDNKANPIKETKDNALIYSYNGYEYSLNVLIGKMNKDKQYTFTPENNKIKFIFKCI